MEYNIELHNGEKILILEELQYWDSTTEYYKVMREQGNVVIVSKEQLQQMTAATRTDMTTLEKLKLFHLYFRGREDVYATKWVNKTGKTGFSPAGEGDWILKKDGQGYRKDIHTYYPYSLEVIEKHIRGKERGFEYGIGIYPMQQDDTTYLVVMDFDNEQAIKEAEVVVKVCDKYNIDILIERSQSGIGIHIWLFFKVAIQASLARQLANIIIQLAMVSDSAMSFNSFDRIIPMQDTLPKKGFGNIIALPLRADKVKEGTTVFLDHQFKQVSNMWRHLETVRRYSLEEVIQLIQRLKSIHTFTYYNKEAKAMPLIIQQGFAMGHQGELIIKKQEITRALLVKLAYLATFPNPEFYKRQKMRTTTWDIPQYITAAREDEENLYLPRGILKQIISANPDIELHESLNEGIPIEVSFKGELRSGQKQALKQMLIHQEGLVIAPTGFGKTVLAAKLIAERKISTLIIVNSIVLAQQWKERLSEFLTIDSEPFKEYTPTGRLKKKDAIGEIYGNKNKQSRIIDIVLFQTLANKEDLKSFYSHYGMIIVDEAHHVAAQTFEDVIRVADVRYIYGLTATLERKDGLEPLIYMRLGDLIYQHKEIIDDSVLIPRYFYPRFTHYSDLDPNLSYVEHLNELQKDQVRNQMIIQDIIDNIQEKRSCIVLTERIEHINILQKMLSKDSPKMTIYALHSQQANKVNNKHLEAMRQSKEPFVLVSTGKFVGEGFDLPQLESIFLCLPISWKGLTRQYIGRLNRRLEDKNELRIYDYIDFSVEMFSKMYQKRMKEILKLGYTIAEDEKTRLHQVRLFDMDDYYEYLKSDINRAKEIFVGIPTLNRGMLSEFEQITASGKKLTLVLSKSKQTQYSLWLINLQALGVNIIWHHQMPQSCVICDQTRIWYGSLRYFAVNKKDATTIRLVNETVAQQLLGQYYRRV